MIPFDEMILQELPEDSALGSFEVDVSEFFHKPKDSVVYTYKEPDLPSTFQIPVDAEKLGNKAECVGWPENLRMTVAMLAMGHHSPPTGNVPLAMVYVRMAQKNRKLFTFLSSRFNTEFPHLMGQKAALEEEKKTGENAEEKSSPS